MHKRSILLFIAVLFGVMAVGSARAEAGYYTSYTYTVGVNDSMIRTQSAYLPDKTITDLSLNAPEEITFGPDGFLYIADTGNRRVLAYDPGRNTVVFELTSEEFRSPRGLYVTLNGDIYVADSQSAAVFRFDREGTLLQTYRRPVENSYGDTAYNPYRVAVDRGGSLYIVSEGVYNGIIQLSGNGEFLGYFAVNKTTLNFFQRMQQLFFTREQKANLQANVPLTFSNVYADKKGMIYSVTMGSSFGLGSQWIERVKKHNTAGQNMLGLIPAAGELTGIATDAQGIIYTCDKRGGIIVYTPDGEYIFDFGAFGEDMDIAGLYTELISITVADDGTLWTCDNKKAYLQSYTPTEFTKNTFHAIDLFTQGQYTASREAWTEVLRLNQMSVLAHNGIGKAYLYEQDYENALLHFQVAGNRTQYSDAFWELRNDILQRNLTYVLLVVLLLIGFFYALKIFDRKQRLRTAVVQAARIPLSVSFVANLVFVFHVARHPFDAYDDMKRGHKGSLPAAILLYGLFFLSFMAFMLGKAFIMQVNIESIDTRALVIGFFAITGLFAFCNHLVTSINDGEGRFKTICMTFAYATGPVTIALLAYTGLTYVITTNEIFLLNFMLGAGATWSLLLLVLGLQELHGYSFGTNMKSLLITLFFMLIVTVVLLILMLLWDQIIQFAQAVGKELFASVFNLE